LKRQLRAFVKLFWEAMMKVCKMMKEVWRWKEEIAEETKGMTSQERIAYYRQAERIFAEKTGGKMLNLPRMAKQERTR
jgi:hypothetical protein